MRSVCYSLAFVCLAHAALAADKAPVPRKIDKAESVLAIYPEDWGLHSRERVPAIILAVWPDGHIVWSEDRINGGAPYYAGSIEPEIVAALLSDFDHDGLFADRKLNSAKFGPDSHFTTMFIKSGKKQVVMQSWHERFEANGTGVARSQGTSGLEGRQRLEVLSKEPAEYLYYRFVWSETRGRLMDLIPNNGKPISGKPTSDAAGVTWHEGPVEDKITREGIQRLFGLLDTDKNGELSEDEFNRSVLVRAKFRRAEITPTFPLARDEFIKLFPKP